MSENVDNLILEQLKGLRDEMRIMGDRLMGLEKSVKDGFEEAEVGRQAIQGVLMGLGHSLYGLETRVEHIEDKLGIEE